MTNDTTETAVTAGTVELVSSEVSGYLGADGKFVYGTPPEGGEVYAQSAEDAIGG